MGWLVRAYLFYAVIIYDSSSHTCLPACLPPLYSSRRTLLVGLSLRTPHRSPPFRSSVLSAVVSASRSFGILMRKRSSNALCLLYFLMNDAYRGSVYVILNTTGVRDGRRSRLVVNVLNRVCLSLCLSLLLLLLLLSLTEKSAVRFASS